MNPAGVIVSLEVRDGLLSMFDGSQTRCFDTMKPPFSVSTCYRAITGKPVRPDVRSWFSARYHAMNVRAFSDEQLNEALDIALSSMKQMTGRKVTMHDFKREIGLLLKKEAA